VVDWSSVLQHVLEYVLPILAVAIVGYLAALAKPLAEQAREWLIAKVGAEQFALAERIVYSLVDAAEQRGVWDDLLKAGKDRKMWVLEQAERELSEHGVVLDLHKLDNLVESAVHDRNYFKHHSEPLADPQPEPRVIGAG
jgi:hypothetical protein